MKLMKSFRLISRMTKIQDKLSKAAKCLEYFTTNEWKFEDDNVRNLTLSLSDSDRKEFCFDVTKIDWDVYIENYVLGIRRFKKYILYDARDEIKFLFIADLFSKRI